MLRLTDGPTCLPAGRKPGRLEARGPQVGVRSAGSVAEVRGGQPIGGVQRLRAGACRAARHTLESVKRQTRQAVLGFGKAECGRRGSVSELPERTSRIPPAGRGVRPCVVHSPPQALARVCGHEHPAREGSTGSASKSAYPDHVHPDLPGQWETRQQTRPSSLAQPPTVLPGRAAEKRTSPWSKLGV